MTQSMKAPARGLSAAPPLAALPLAALAVAGVLAAAPWPAAADSVSSDPGYVAAMERLEAEDYAAAAALLEKLAERLPDSPEVYNYLAYTYRKLGQEDAALAHYQRALFLEPGRRDLRAELGALYLARGNVREAEAQLAEIDRLCFLSCREYRALKTEIEDFRRLQAQRNDAGKAAAPVGSVN